MSDGKVDLDASRMSDQIRATPSESVAGATSQADGASGVWSKVLAAGFGVLWVCAFIAGLHFGLVLLYSGWWGENVLEGIPAIGPFLGWLEDVAQPTATLIIGVVVGFVLVVISDAWRVLLPWVPVKTMDGFELIFSAGVLLLWLTFVFVFLTTWMYARGFAQASQSLDLGGGLVLAAEEHYVFHLFGEVPLLKIPETLDWKPQVTFTDDASRALLLCYRILVILPVIRVAAELIRRKREGEAIF
jgi:hypothetical protein